VITVTAACGGCGWTASGDWAGVDRQAEKHTRRGHATCTTATLKREDTDGR
jgi:hypothetical protein